MKFTAGVHKRLGLPLIVVVTLYFLVVWPVTSLAQYKTEKPPYSDFLNYGKKKVKPGPELENEIIKSKVEVLGEILKSHVQTLRQVPDQRIELVFLVDASASVGAENFFNEIKFVKKLLADFAVSYNQTRVAVITFSSKSKVIRHIDHITQASEENHKCTLLESELPRIRYSGGGTYTLGAFLEAQSVLALSRGDATKAVFLVTDGYSNGGDPRPAADFLQARGVRIFTFGIRNGNVKELYDMASEPKEEHSYILDSFEEFEALARRALHEDLHSGVLMAQDPRSCQNLCTGSEYCCDAYAFCTCGTHTGHYACTCGKGYYGTGLRGDCRPCPPGTYRDAQGPGDISSCIPCPDPQMNSEPGSISSAQCYCKRGYKQVGNECILLQCPALAPPENGYFVRNTCNNVVNAACGVRCNPGYTLQGSSIRLCGENGQWSGGDAECVMKMCPELKPTTNGTMVCSKPHPTMDTECYFTCDPGFQLVGSKKRTCLPVAMWDGIPTYCKAIFCPALPKLKYGQVRPVSCITAKSKYGTRCEFACDPGYQISGPIKSTCVDPGVWTEGHKSPRCVDVTPPVIQCPENITVATDLHEVYATVSWNPPHVKDNSKGEIGLNTIPATTQPMKMKIGNHTITYVAKDMQGNRASCQFTVTVLDKEAPQIDWCDSPPIFLSHDDNVDVYWEEPIFSDNSGGEVEVVRSMDPGQFPQGETVVEYVAFDSAGNVAACNITITVQKHACQLPVDPINGASNCTENPNAVYCTLSCEDGYAFAHRPSQDYFCAYDGVWLPDDNPLPFPDCSVMSVSNSVAQAGEIAMDDDGSVCDDIFFMGQVENELEKKLEEALGEMCADDVLCEVAAVEAICENILADVEEESNSIGFFRKRRSITDDFDYYWPQRHLEEESWKYWRRGADSLLGFGQRTKRAVEHDEPERYLRRKRQFGFSLDDMFGNKATTESPVHGSKKVQEDYLGVLIDLISRSLASDIGISRFGSFLSDLRSNDGKFSTEDFFTAFAKEFGEDKTALLRELASKKLSGMNIMGSPGLEIKDNHTGSPIIFDDHDGFPPIPLHSDHSYFTQESQPPQESSQKALKVRFKIEGHGSEAADRVVKAMDGILKAADNGLFDVSYGSQQLQVAAIRLKEDPEYICEPGSVLRGDLCIKCPVGTFFNVVLRECQACPQGSFQSQEGQVSCLVCPENTSTKSGNAKSGADCKAQCLPGSYSEDGLEPCTTCELGQYQDEYASLSCVSCPQNTTTWRRGSWVIDECEATCKKGHVSETGLEPCLQCPRGFFQEEEGQIQCLRCPHGVTTPNAGSTSIFDCEGISDQEQAVYTSLPTLPVNECFSEPCLNGGSCTVMDFGYVCQCQRGFAGQQCETDINECESEPCLNNGTCINLIDAFFCECPPGFTGSQCETDINECNPDPCLNGATCINLVDAFQCACQSGYTGEICDIDIDECATNPCAEGATCEDLLNDMICHCPPGDTGRFCETHINECDSSPCDHGLCIDKANAFSCVCEPGYTGNACEIDINDCESQPCLNGGTCKDWVNGFSCTCAPGFTGKQCDTEMSTDFVLEFPAPDILDYVSLENLPHDLTSVSLCFWLRSEDKNNYGTPFSYATDEHDNALTVTDYNGFVVYVNGDKRITDVSGNDGQWHMFCFTWKSDNGTWAVYVDGNLADSGTGLAPGAVINGTGTLVIGQEQDQRRGGYNPQESYIGDITLLNVWEEELSQTYIANLFIQCDRYIGTVLGWPDLQAGVKGKVTVKSSTFCRGCGIPFVPENGRIEEISSEKMERIRVVCAEGFKLYRGDEERICLINGTWSGEEPVCQRVECDFPGYLMNGHIEGSSYSFGDTVSYTCNPGFNMKGGEVRRCQANGLWTDEQPQCEVIKCPHITVQPHGEVLSFLSDYVPSNQISFRCEEGYQMDGPATLTCGGDGEWNGDPPSCQSETCKEFPTIVNGYIEGGPEVRPGEQVEAKCDAGYKIEGDPIIICKDDATWSLPLPKCVTPVCPKPPGVTNGQVKVRASASATEAVYKCDFGYELIGNKVLHCSAEGEWDAPWSDCVGVPCPEPAVPPHANIPPQEVWRIGDNLTYECDIGFDLQGEKSLKCVFNGNEGEWEGSVPFCKVVKCPVPTKPENGIVSVIHRPPAADTQSPFSLIPQVSGEIELRRKRSPQDDFPSIVFPAFPPLLGQNREQEWSPDYEFDYSSQGQATNDYFGQSAVGFEDFSQNAGHGLEFSQNTGDYDFYGQSQNGFEFSQNTGQVPSDYGFVSQSSNGFEFGQSTDDNYEDFGQTASSSSDFEQGVELVERGEYLYGTKLEYDCRPGYMLLGERYLHCTESGNWNTTQPRCYEQFCTDLPPLQNGRITYHGSGVNSRAEFICNEGYKLGDGDFELICQLDKTWLGKIPTCQIVDCGNPRDVANGTVEFTTTTFGSVSTYDCFFGFVIEGSFERYCNARGKWNNTMPKCVAVTCSVPPVIDDGYITFEGSLYVNSPIEYECKECYYLNGTRFRYCQVDGSWSLEEPFCTLLYCDELPTTIPNGKVIGNDNSCGSLVEYECSPGYRLQGKPKATCLENKKWSSPPPVCEREACGPPPVLPKGRHIGVSYKFTDKITYECNEGHILQGSNVMVCGADGAWSGSLPYCAIVNCTKPQGPSNGKVRLSGLFFGSYANTVCDPGYKLEGENHAQCDASGKWTKKIPRCIPVVCPDAPEPPFSSYNSTEQFFEAFNVLAYECNPGYKPVNDKNILTCSASGVWEGELIRCEIVRCGDPGTLPHGSIRGDNFNFGGIVSFSCDEGYNLLGQATASCLADGTWSNYATSCLQITCPEPQQIEFGNIISGDINSIYGAAISYKCEVGYVMTGNSDLTCNVNGAWSGDYPQCRPVTCPEPPEALNSEREGDIYEYGKTINYECNEGFAMQGEPDLLCQANGTWSNSFPVCEMITCEDIPDIPNGNWKVKKLSDRPVKTQPLIAKGSSKGFGAATQFAKLQELLQVDARERIIHTYGDIIEFSCNTGYFMTSSKFTECTEDGWSEELPQCHPISCPIPIQIRHGTVIGDDYSYGATITYECDEGHELVGESSRKCLETKEWSDTEPLCRVIECPRPALLDNGQTIGWSIKYGSILSYVCDVGFRLEGTATRMCQSNGHWTGEQPVCVELFCELPDQITHGIRDIGSLKVGGTVRYSCLEGYRLLGRTVINCGSDGQWDAVPPTCQQIDCGPPPTAENVIVHGNKTIYNSKVSFVCERGYRLQGQEWSTCLQSGRWSSEAPACIRVICLEPTSPAHGRLVEPDPKDNEIVTSGNLHSAKGKHNGGKTRSKTRKGTKSSKMVMPEAAEKMYYVDDEVSWICDEGFQLEGEGSATCLPSGDWSSSPPRCRRVSCGPPELPDHASVTGGEFLYAATVIYTCRDGYEMKGESVLKCEANGQWNSSPPVCEPRSCGPITLPEHVQVRYMTLEHHDKPHSLGSNAIFSCEQGYRLEGDEIQVCEANSKWSGSTPTCDEMLCNEVPYVPHGQVVKDDTKRPQIAILSCDYGYNLTGIETTECHLGQWKEFNASCEPVSCCKPDVPPYGKITANDFNYGSIANYSCIYGYMLIGNPSIECDGDGEWRGETPICQPVDCGTPEAPSNGHVESSLTDLGSEALYYCNKGYQLFGNDSRTCIGDATWEGELPQCLRVNCGEVTPPPKGFVMGSGSLYGDRIKFTCEEGYYLEGESQAECIETGNWSAELPSCKPVPCEFPPPPPNVQRLTELPTGYYFGDKLTYRCQEGHIMRGRLTIRCLASGTFSKVEGQCSKISCGRPKINTDGSVILGRSFYYRDKVVYRCPPGTVANGSTVMTCQGDGSWTGAPSCVGKCSRQCLNGGICVSNNQCLCTPGFMGDRCQHAMCVAPCLNGGTCVGPYKCKCLPGYGGPRCQNHICENGCGDRGTCIGPNVCHCDRGYSGPSCDVEDYDYSYYEDTDRNPDQTNFGDWDIVPFYRRHRLYNQ